MQQLPGACRSSTTTRHTQLWRCNSKKKIIVRKGYTFIRQHALSLPCSMAGMAEVISNRAWSAYCRAKTRIAPCRTAGCAAVHAHQRCCCLLREVLLSLHTCNSSTLHTSATHRGCYPGTTPAPRHPPTQPAQRSTHPTPNPAASERSTASNSWLSSSRHLAAAALPHLAKE